MRASGTVETLLVKLIHVVRLFRQVLGYKTLQECDSMNSDLALGALYSRLGPPPAHCKPEGGAPGGCGAPEPELLGADHTLL